ncbi:hypothetical protein COU74_02095 [Candidatus Peregrinibacteria bacterium CG10_big_fil_rev_8_21_14_0_10_36_19]|nr:MAG: hypothetical protein COU74_02095 [Candidatus Peregrinibacteria bacterium CG10_big_fil_rev_8_21_14_0_10_36_19]
MSDDPITAIANCTGECAKVAQQLLRLVNDYVQPSLLKRKAHAEAEYSQIILNAELSGIEQRSLSRVLKESVTQQSNIDNIVTNSIPELKPNGRPEQIEDDWIASFFNRAKHVSDTDMQMLWSKILAGESNQPGSFSKRTIDFLGALEKHEAELFRDLCTYNWMIDKDTKEYRPFIHNHLNEIYSKRNLTFSELQHLDKIGLIHFQENPLAHYTIKNVNKNCKIWYQNSMYSLVFPKDENMLNTGQVILTYMGHELSKIFTPQFDQVFVDFMIDDIWKRAGIVAQKI